MLSASSVERAAADVIERAAGRRDDDVGAAFEGADLLRHRGAAVERHDGKRGAAGVLVDGLGHLHRQLAGRHQDEPARPRAAAPSSRPAAALRWRR